MNRLLRDLIRVVALLAIVVSGATSNAQQAANESSAARPNMVGAYGPWLSDKVLGDGPARLSFRTGNRDACDDWRRAARARVWECMAPVDLGGKPDVRV